MINKENVEDRDWEGEENRRRYREEKVSRASHLGFPLIQCCQTLWTEAVTPRKPGMLSELCPRMELGRWKPVILLSDSSCILVIDARLGMR